MPIPPIVDHYSAQVIFKGKTGQPEDVYTNTFYFHNNNFGGTHDSVADQLADDLLEFYNATPNNVVNGLAIVGGMSSAIINADFDIRVYALGDAAPRYPKIRTRTLTALSANALPSEVCVCLSLVAQQNQPRNRGRIFIGPLSNSVMTVVNGRPTVTDAYRTGLLGSLIRLKDKPSFEWCVYSKADNAMKVISGGWVDNAFDTQRRRGEKANLRTVAGTYLGQSGTTDVLV